MLNGERRFINRRSWLPCKRSLSLEDVTGRLSLRRGHYAWRVWTYFPASSSTPATTECTLCPSYPDPRTADFPWKIDIHPLNQIAAATEPQFAANTRPTSTLTRTSKPQIFQIEHMLLPGYCTLRYWSTNPLPYEHNYASETASSYLHYSISILCNHLPTYRFFL